MKSIDIFSEAAMWTNEGKNATVTVTYEANGLRVHLQEVTGVIEDNGQRVRVFEIQEAFRLDEDGDEIGLISPEKIELVGLVRLPTVGQWALIRDEEILTVSEVAALAEVGRQYVHDEIGRGAFGVTGKIGTQRTIKGLAFVEWMNKPSRGSRRKSNAGLQ